MSACLCERACDIHDVRACVFELHSSYVSYLIVSAGTDLEGAILAGDASGGSHYGGRGFRFLAGPDYYLLIF